MKQSFSDITDRLGKPLWYDSLGYPRYCEFSPSEVADIYADEAVLVLIECQNCGTEFQVAFHATKYDRWQWVAEEEDRNVARFQNVGGLAEAVQSRKLHYGDPPAGCCGVGATMNSVPLRVLEFWRSASGTWERVAELETDIRPSWAQPLDVDVEQFEELLGAEALRELRGDL